MSEDTDMKFRSVTKLDKRHKTTKNYDDDVLSVNCNVTVIFPVYGLFGAIWKPDSRCIARYIFINSNLLSCKN